MRLIGLLTVFICHGLMTSSVAHASSPYNVDLTISGAAMSIGFGVAAGLELWADEKARLSCHPCRSDAVNAFDRTAIAPEGDEASKWTDEHKAGRG